MSDELKRDYQEKLGEKFGAIFQRRLVRLGERIGQTQRVPGSFR